MWKALRVNADIKLIIVFDSIVVKIKILSMFQTEIFEVLTNLRQPNSSVNV